MKRYVFTFILIIVMSVAGIANLKPQPRPLNRPPRQNPEILKAQEFEVQKEYEEAKKIYQRIYESGRTDIVFWKLLLLCEKTRDFKGMERLALQRLKKNKNDVSTLQYLARAYYGQSDRRKGRRTLLKIIGDRWTDEGRIHVAANEFMHQNDIDSVLNVYITARKHLNRQDVFADNIARIYSLRMDYISAIGEYMNTIDTIKITYSKVEEMIKNAREYGEKPADIERPISRYLDDHPESINAARLLSELKYEAGDFNGAYIALAPTAVASVNPQDMWNLAERFKNDGHMDEALMAFADFYMYFEKHPKRVSSLLESASIRADRGDIEGARKDYQRLARDYRGTRNGETASLRMIQLAETTMDIEAFAQTLSNFASKTHFRTVAREAYLILGKTLLRNNCPEQSEEAFEQARTKSRSRKELYEVISQTALLNFFTGDFDAMSRNIKTCLKNDPGGEKINDLLTFKVLVIRCYSVSELKRLKTYAGGQFAFYRGEVSTAVDSFLVAAKDTSSVVTPYAASALARIYNMQGDDEKAVSWYLYAASAARDSTIHVGALIDAADVLVLKSGKSERAKTLYSEALTSYPGNVHESEIRRKLKRQVSNPSVR